jgi:hypothetical protein
MGLEKKAWPKYYYKNPWGINGGLPLANRKFAIGGTGLGHKSESFNFAIILCNTFAKFSTKAKDFIPI